MIPRKFFLLLGSFALVLNISLQANVATLFIGQIDNFQNSTTEGWRIGQSGGPVNISNGGDAGTGDAFLRYVADAANASGKMIIFNDNQWRGNYLNAGIQSISAYVKNPSSSQFNLRLAFGTTTSAQGGNWFSSTNSIDINAGSDWTKISFPITESDLTSVSGSGTFNSVMSNVGSLRILSSSTPSNRGATLSATLEIDDITAIPEPSTIILMLVGLLVIGFSAKSRI